MNPVQKLWQLRPAPRHMRAQSNLLALMLADEVGLARLRRALDRERDWFDVDAGEEITRYNGLMVVLTRWTLDEPGVIGEEDVDAMRYRGHIGRVVAGCRSQMRDGRVMPLLVVRFERDGRELPCWQCDLLIPGTALEAEMDADGSGDDGGRAS